VSGAAAAVAVASEPAPASETAVAVASEPEVAPDVSPDADLASLKQSWSAVMETVRTSNPLLAAVIAEAQPAALARGELTIAFPSEAAFLCRKAQEAGNRQLVSDAVRTVTGHGLRLSYELREDLVAPSGPHLSEEEWVDRFMAEFDAEELEGERGERSGPSSSESEESATAPARATGAANSSPERS
jgi:hypothetical protein